MIYRLQQVNLVVGDINSQAKELASSYEPSLETFSPNFEKLLGQFSTEFDRYRLDEVIVAAIAPIVRSLCALNGNASDGVTQVRRMLAQWHPLHDPCAFTRLFRIWRNALKMAVPDEKPQDQVSVYGISTVISSAPAVYVSRLLDCTLTTDYAFPGRSR